MKKTFVLAALLVIIIVIGYQLLKPEGSLEQQKMDADFETERITATGKLVGFKEDNNSHAWYGIPFARAPIGELRWKAPLPADKWEGTRKAVEFGPICTQFADMGAQGRASKKEYGNPVGSEDCLFLNIWAPAFSLDKIPHGNDRLPVMVWIHGGGNSIGHGSSNNGKILAEKYNLVLVTLNYRLGPFGWFTHPVIREEGTTPEDQSGSYGTLDIIRALTWVQENIENFGGNPENVTIFGESAGGRNSLSMMLAPKAKGLFHKAIIQSGSLGAKSIASAENYKDAKEPGHAFSSRETINRLLIKDKIVADRDAAKAYQNKMSNKDIIKYLYSQNNFNILNTYKAGLKGMGMINFPNLIKNGITLKKGDVREPFKNIASYNNVPIIIGGNHDENKLFMVTNPQYVNRYFGLYIVMKDEKLYELVSHYRTGKRLISGTYDIASILRDTQGPNVYAYRFDWDEEPTILGMDLSVLIGAAHFLEIPFVFGMFKTNTLLDFAFTRSNRPGREAVSISMMSYWAEFAYSGSPGKGRDGRELEWKPWDNTLPESNKIIIFDTPQDNGIRMSTDIITLENLKKDLLTETFSSQEKHCEMYVNLFNDTDLWNEEEYKNLGTTGCREFSK